MKSYVIALAALFLSSCTMTASKETADTQLKNTQVKNAEYQPKPGSNQMLRSPITIAEDLEVVISDVVIPPNKTVPRHYHPGEEFVYVIEGSAVHVEEGKPDQILKAGDTYVIPPQAEHAPRGGAEGARAIVFRVHPKGEAERTMVEE